MVSARVLNPVMLSEFCKMSASPSVSRNLPCGRQVNRIKRNLFGSPSATEASTNKTPFTAELERHQELATQKWGFNFRAGCPLADNSSFTWEVVSFQGSSYAPNMYTLTRAAHVRPSEESSANDMDGLINERAERENFTVNVANSSLESNTDNDSCYDSQDESLSVRFTPSSLSHSLSSTTSPLTLRKRQPKITEFMKERKRLAQAPKKLSPVKRLRTSSPSSSSSSGFGLGAHFGAMLKRPRHN
ncbi:cyclin-dependent kinase inhibitor 1 [Drosophila guanche]|uniref:Blast:Cyclin-dependent kinase inhibitor 1 n=1 Tax=Drosophila guanche TaxID=7266 RepID=A0A3B0IZV8_DROGU|nr:cyclin-dependent kinase inhibitor 1 [Drosophila guanche]SPP74034.1 blast:Cyclin-dependent kinase inhibitor 1 [Drosophila guanche]